MLRLLCISHSPSLVFWKRVTLFVYRNDFIDLKRHVLLEYKESNLKMKKYFIKDMAVEWDLYIEGKRHLEYLDGFEYSLYLEAPPSKSLCVSCVRVELFLTG